MPRVMISAPPKRLRFLLPAAPERIRFGWLRVMAGLVGTSRLGIAELAEGLWQQHVRFNDWIEASGLTEAPTGNVRQSAANKLARMGITYGIYNESTEALTDLGHVLRVVSGWTPTSTESPFTWNPAQKWIGLRILFEGAGDAILAILRRFPSHGKMDDLHSLTGTVADALAELLANAARDQHGDLQHQLRRCASDSGRRGVIQPYLEPLRDLGYAVSKGAGYQLTTTGIKLKSELETCDLDADGLIQEGLSRIFIKAEGYSNPDPAAGSILRQVILSLPPELTVSETEAPLEPIALLAQATLLQESPGAWMDPTLAHELLRKIGARIEGTVFLRSGLSIHDFPNVAWIGDVFADESHWDVISGGSTGAMVPSENPASSTTFREDADEMAHFYETPMAHPLEHVPASTDAELSSLDPEPAPDLPDETNSNDPVPIETATPARAVVDPFVLLSRDTRGSLRLWLQYVVALLDKAEIGGIDLTRWGGFETSLRRLETILSLPQNKLNAKRKKCFSSEQQPPPLVPLVRLAESAKNLPNQALISRVKKQWVLGSDDQQKVPPNPRAAIERALAFCGTLNVHLRDEIAAFIEDASTEPNWKNWGKVREWTRGIIHDALCSGRWERKELLSRLTRQLAPTNSLGQTLITFLGELARTEVELVYIEQLRIHSESALSRQLQSSDELRNDVVECHIIPDDSDDDSPREPEFIEFELRTVVKAYSTLEARMIGRTRVRAFILTHTSSFASALNDKDAPHLCEHQRRDKLLDPQKIGNQEMRIEWPEDRLVVGASFRSFHQSTSTPELAKVAATHRILGPLDRRSSRLDGRDSRIARAWYGLTIARDPQRTAAERLALSWSAVEQLVKGGEEGKDAAIFPCAKVATLVHIRKQLARIHRDTMAALWARTLLDHSNPDVMKQFDLWIPNMAASLSKLKLIPSTTLKNMWASGTLPALDDVTDENALSRLWQNWDELPELRNVIEPIAPLAANELYQLMEWFAKDLKKLPEEIGNGIGLAKYAYHSYEDIESFLFFVYELRNRFVHDGEGFEDAQQITIIQILERFVALVEPVLVVVSSQVELTRSIEQTFELARDLFDDLMALGKDSNENSSNQRKLTRERVHELLFALGYSPHT